MGTMLTPFFGAIQIKGVNMISDWEGLGELENSHHDLKDFTPPY